MRKNTDTVKTKDLKDKLFLQIAKPYKDPAISKNFGFRYLLTRQAQLYDLKNYSDMESNGTFSFYRNTSKAWWIAGDYKLGVWDEDTPDMS